MAINKYIKRTENGEVIESIDINDSRITDDDIENWVTSDELIYSRFEENKAIIGNQVAVGGGNSNVYSLGEDVIVGKWINGKNIYRHTMQLSSAITISTSATSGRVEYDGASNIEQCIAGYAFRTEGTGNMETCSAPVFAHRSSDTTVTFYSGYQFSRVDIVAFDYTKKVEE